MVTGYFGAATAAGVKNFQRIQGLPQTGMTDGATAAAISRVSCSGNAGGSYQTYPNILTYPAQYSYPYTSYYSGTTAITSLSQNTGSAGNNITIYGVGFDQWNNTVNFGNTVLTNIPSQNGTSLSVIVPSNYYAYSLVGTSVHITVQNSRGTSNAVAFTVMGNPYPCNIYSSIPCSGCSYPYPLGYNAYCNPQNTATPIVNYLSPASGAVGTAVTVYGAGFSTSNNTVRFGSGIIANLGSSDGRAVSFTVPSQLVGYGTQPVTLSTYQVSVTNSFGITSNAVPFLVTALAGGGAPVITSVQGPANLATGVQGVWNIAVNTAGNQYLTFSVNWGDQNMYGATPQSQLMNSQQTNTLTHTYYSAGTYTITFTVANNFGQQNTYTTTVVVGQGNSGNLSLAYISPISGPVGTRVAIQGQGFSAYENTVRFGNGGTMHVPSNNGTTIYYTIPSYVSPCDVQTFGTVCAMYAQQVTPGSYPIYVTNAQGTSNTLNFNVQ